MKIYIELIIIFAAIVVFFPWMIWFNISRWRAKKKYDPNNDRSKQGEDKRRATDGTEQGTHRETGSSIGSREPEGRQNIQEIPSSIPRPHRSGIRKLLNRRR